MNKMFVFSFACSFKPFDQIRNEGVSLVTTFAIIRTITQETTVCKSMERMLSAIITVPFITPPIKTLNRVQTTTTITTITTTTTITTMSSL